jgi:hypothetical protein
VRLGCGCLVFILLVAAAVAGLGWATFQALQRPDGVPAVAAGREDAVRAQEKIYGLIARGSRRGSPGTVVLTEGELNAFLDRHVVEIADLPLSEAAVRLPAVGVAEILGRVPVAYLLRERPLSSVQQVIPRSWLEHRVWIRLRGAVRIERGAADRRYLRLDVERFWIGRQGLPAVVPRLFLDPSAVGWLRWSLPRSVEDVRIEPGRAVVRTGG